MTQRMFTYHAACREVGDNFVGWVLSSNLCMSSRDRTLVARLEWACFTGPLMELLITTFTAKLFFFLMKYHFEQVVEIKALNWFLELLKLCYLTSNIPLFMEPLGALLGNVVFVEHSMKITDREHTAMRCSVSTTLCLRIAFPSLATTTTVCCMGCVQTLELKYRFLETLQGKWAIHINTPHPFFIPREALHS